MFSIPSSKFGERMALPGRRRKVGVERTPSGRISRKGLSKATFFAVYVAAFPAGLVKVGRTCDLARRMSNLQSWAGEMPVVCAELHVANLDDSIALERHVISLLLSEGYERERLEWFHVPFTDLPKLVTLFNETSPVSVVRNIRRGDEMFEWSDHSRHQYEVRRSIFGHRTHDLRS